MLRYGLLSYSEGFTSSGCCGWPTTQPRSFLKRAAVICLRLTIAVSERAKPATLDLRTIHESRRVTPSAPFVERGCVADQPQHVAFRTPELF